MKNIASLKVAWIVILAILLIPQWSSAQNLIFQTTADSLSKLTTEQRVTYDTIVAKSSVNKVYFVDTYGSLAGKDSVEFRIVDSTYSPTILKEDVKDDLNYTWYGGFDDGDGIFFISDDGQLGSQFTVNGTNYMLIALDEELHLLIEFNKVDFGKCDNDPADPPQGGDGPESHHDDDLCNLRVLVATTPAAREEITSFGVSVPTFVRFSVAQTNLTYILSGINIQMELAILMGSAYVESGDMATDVNHFRNGALGWTVAHLYRAMYRTDVQIMIQKSTTQAFGRAFHIPTSSEPFNQANAFCTVTVSGVTFGRYTFAHEVAHLQGARHNTHTASPSYARGHLLWGGSNALRTIMAINNNDCDPTVFANGCRVGHFSNPNILFQGWSTGTTDRNNARRLNETAATINNYRVTPTVLNLATEVIFPNTISHHLAVERIDSDNNLVVYESNSRGTMRCDDEIILRPGVKIKSGSKFRAYISDPACESLPKLRVKQQLIDDDFDEMKSKVNIYPNPSKNQFTIEGLNENTLIEVRNVQGQLVFSKRVINDQLTIDLSGFSKGMYILRGTNDDQSFTEKIIKE